MVDAVIDTPTTTTETPSAAPATSAPPPSTRPASFEQALEQADAANASPTPAKPATAATVPPGEPTAPVTGEGAPPVEAKGPIPFEVHHKALENARTKTIEARDQQWQEKAGWVLALPPDHQAAAPDLVRDFYAHPPSFVMNVIKAMEGHPQYGPQMRALLSLVTGNGHSNGNGHGAPADGEPPPDLEVIVNPQTGQTVQTYSAQQLAKRDEYRARQLEQRFEQRLKPIEEERKAAKAKADEAEFKRQATATVDQQADSILKILDGKTDLLVHVNALMDQGVPWHAAAIQVRDQHLKPQQQQTATATAADVMRRKAAANTANGSGSAVTPMTRPKTEKDLAALLEQMDRG